MNTKFQPLPPSPAAGGPASPAGLRPSAQSVTIAPPVAAAIFWCYVGASRAARAKFPASELRSYRMFFQLAYKRDNNLL